jgi:hypothetical protein
MDADQRIPEYPSGHAGTGGGLRYIHEIATTRMVNQEHNYSCVIACVRQLLRDASCEITEAELVTRIGIIEGWGAGFEWAAEALAELHPRRSYIFGGAYPEQLEAHCQRGVWIARVRTLGGRPHAVIVDGLESNEVIAVRDPWGPTGPGSGIGTQATMKLTDFHEHWLAGMHYGIFPGKEKGGLS